jgi:hypothetical protein
MAATGVVSYWVREHGVLIAASYRPCAGPEIRDRLGSRSACGQRQGYMVVRNTTQSYQGQ